MRYLLLIQVLPSYPVTSISKLLVPSGQRVFPHLGLGAPSSNVSPIMAPVVAPKNHSRLQQAAQRYNDKTQA